MQLRDLILALSATPKKPDIRDCLNGVFIGQNEIIGSNGHLLCRIQKITGLSEIDKPIIVPTKTIRSLINKVGKKNFLEDVTYYYDIDRYYLSCGDEDEIFKPIPAVYPDLNQYFKKFIVNNDPLKHNFNWNLVAFAQNAIEEYRIPKGRFYNFDNELFSGGFFKPAENIIYLIMKTT